MTIFQSIMPLIGYNLASLFQNIIENIDHWVAFVLLSIIGIVVPFTALGHFIGLAPIPASYMTVILGVPILYCFVALFAKKIYIKKYGEWI